MTEAEGPRRARPEEFEELARTADWFFDFEAGGYRARWPQAFDDSEPLPHAIVRVDGEIVSHVAAIPQTLVVGETELECWGITGVGTLPPHRGNGHMGQLLSFWVEQMDAQDVPLSDLNGDRLRYNRYGWELAGREAFYRMSGRLFDGEPTVADAVRPYAGTAADRAFVREIHEREPLRIVRDEGDYVERFDKRGIETLLYDVDGERAYVCFERENSSREVTEFGGDERGVETLLGHVLVAYDTDTVVVRAHPEHESTRLFRTLADRWRIEPHRLLNVRDLRAVVAAFAPRLTDRWRPRFGEGTVTLGIEGGEAVALQYGPEGVTASPCKSDPDVELDRLAMTRLLFGAAADRPGVDADSFLAAALPLSFYLWRTDAV